MPHRRFRRALGTLALVGIAAGSSLPSGIIPAGAQDAPRGCPPWQAVPSPSPRPFSVLLAVSASSEDDAWAVGWQGGEASFPATLAEHWNGTSWTVVPTPDPGTALNVLTGVAAISLDDAWAVGYRMDDGSSFTLMEHWDGVRWTLVPGADPGKRFNDLQAVAAASSSDVWAVGLQSPQGGSFSPLLEHWDGTAWSAVAAPRQTQDEFLSDVTAEAADDAWAVGYRGNSGPFHTLTLHWNGTAWTAVGSPDPLETNVLQAVSATGRAERWAVGSEIAGGRGQGLNLRWDGTAWARVPGARVGSVDSHLRGVAGRSPDAVWAAGYRSAGHDLRPLIEHWNGAAWVRIPSPNAGTGSGFLLDAAVSGRVTWAVGAAEGDGDGGAQRTLVLRRAPCGDTASRTRVEGGRSEPATDRGWRVPRGAPCRSDCSADLHAAFFDTDPIAFGQPILYGLTVRNRGPDSATGTFARLHVPHDMRFVWAHPDQGSCAYVDASRTVTCRLGTVPATGLRSKPTVHVVLSAGRPNWAHVVMSVGSLRPDPVHEDNRASDTTIIIP